MEREPGVLLAVVFLMVVAEGVRNQAATRELRAELCTARPMVVAGDVNFLVAQKVQKVAQTFVLPMVVVEDAVMMVALGLREGNQDCAFGMVVGRDVRKKIAQEVLKASQACAFHMEVVVDAKPQDAQKERKGARCSAKHMVVENAAQLQDAPRVLKGAHLFVRAMGVGKDVPSKVLVFVQKAFMEGPISVLRTGVVRDVLYLNAPRVQEDEQIFVFVMVVEKDASLKGAAKVPRAAQISARHMVGGRDVLGVILDQNMESSLLVHATHLQGVRLVSVHFIVAWCRIRGFMVVLL